MTVLIVLAGLLISHMVATIGRWRQFDWLLWPIRALRERFPDLSWLPMVLVLVIGILIPVLAIWVMTAMFGVGGWIVLALVAFVYTLGPRDLDQDVRLLREREVADDVSRVREAADAMQLRLDDSPESAAASVFHGALSRWFGILFWFVILGIPGAVLYRLNRMALQMPELEPGEIEWLARMRIVLDWPVQALMMIGVGLCGDLDRVWRAWQELREEGSAWLITPIQLDRIAHAIVPSEADFDEGLMAGHRMMWRVLALWLVVMSVLLLAGLLA
jgi:AmpE protein